MYGETFNAKIDICSKEPPVNEFNKLKESPSELFKNCLIASELIIGDANWHPTLITINIKNVYRSFCLNSLILKAFRRV